MAMLGKTSTTISTIAILWPVKAIFEKRAATVEVDTLNVLGFLPSMSCFSLSVFVCLSKISLSNKHTITFRGYIYLGG